MKDKRLDKITQHYDLFINNQKYKVLSCKILEVEHRLSIKTKIRGQAFPHSGRFDILIPSEKLSIELCVAFQSMSSSAAIEHWEYTIVPD